MGWGSLTDLRYECILKEEFKNNIEKEDKLVDRSDCSARKGLNQKKFLCRFCGEVFESEYGLYCIHCGRFQTNTANPKPPEPLR